MKNEFIAIYRGDVDLHIKGEIDKIPIFYSKVINDELWFVTEGDEEFRYSDVAVFEDDDWFVYDKSILPLLRARLSIQ